MQKTFFTLVLAAISLIAAERAVAQATGDGQKKETRDQGSGPAAAQNSVSEQAGKAEPGAKAKTSEVENVFANGILTVPGAPNDPDTAPAKFSQRTAADDQMPIAAYRLKPLSPDQRADIARQLPTPRPEQRAQSSGYANIGAELPAAISLEGLTPLPEALTSKYAGLRGTAFMISDGKIVIVDRDNNLVVGVLAPSR